MNGSFSDALKESKDNKISNNMDLPKYYGLVRVVAQIGAV